MAKQSLPMLTIEIPKPCSLQWDELTGDNQSRYCTVCQKNVIAVAEQDLEQLAKLFSGPTLPCVMVQRHSNGQVITAENRRSLRGLARVWSSITWAIVAILGSVGMSGCGVKTTGVPVIGTKTMGKPMPAIQAGQDAAAPDPSAPKE